MTDCIRYQDNKDIPLLVLANKQDLPSALGGPDVSQVNTLIWTPYHRVSELVTDPNIVVSNFLFFRVGISIKKFPVSDLFSPMASFSQWTSE